MKKKSLLLLIAVGIVSVTLSSSLLAQDSHSAIIAGPETPKEAPAAADTASSQAQAAASSDASEAPKDKGIDWFSLAVGTGYLVGVLVLLPLVVYINMKEKLYDPEKDKGGVDLRGDSLEEREAKAAQILEEIASGWSKVPGEDGQMLLSITKRSQALKAKAGLDYISKHLAPEDPEILERIEELKFVYENRNKRYFTGSKWVLGAAIALGLVFFYSMGITAFAIIHTLGVVFYFLSSRTPAYILERRMELFGKLPGFVSTIMGGLMVGMAAKHYVSINGGPWKRDDESEFSNAMILIFLMVVIAMLLGFLAAFLGVINFLINYLGTFLMPWKSIEQRYQEKFAAAA